MVLIRTKLLTCTVPKRVPIIGTFLAFWVPIIGTGSL